ncbi:MAG: DUF3108 domain-containing protein [Bacteroidota bacterium]|nr:DUF3108 domain-containing protein [Bacteroidota bacterium]
MIGVASAVAQPSTVPCAPSTANMRVFQEGEELAYEVSYLGIGLGAINTRIISVDSTKAGLRIATECLIRTYRGIPFISLNTRFQSVVGDSLHTTFFRNKEFLSEDSVYKYIEYTFPKNRGSVYITETVDRHPEWAKRDTIDLEGKRWQDGLSLFYSARAFSHSRQSCRVPVLMYFDKAVTKIRFGVAEEDEDIDAFDHDIRCRRLEGETGFTGIFGLTGGFEGWFSDDAAAVPIRAKMHVYIGSVNIELIKWKRKGWKPPRAAG